MLARSETYRREEIVIAAWAYKEEVLTEHMMKADEDGQGLWMEYEQAGR